MYFTHIVTELIKKRQDSETLTDILKLNDATFLKLKRQFENRINKLFCHPLLGHLADNQDIDYAIMQVLSEIVKVQRNQKRLTIHTIYAQNELLQTPIFKALFDCNIIWKSKYYEHFHLEHQLYVHVVQDWLEQRYQGMNQYERICFWLYKKKN